MDFELTPELRAVVQAAREYVSREIVPRREEDERRGEFPREQLRAIARAGFFGSVIPEEFGGTGAGYVAHSLIVEEFCRGNFVFGTAFNVQGASVPWAILRWGTDEQKRRFVEPLVKAEWVGCHAITEPGAGSDVAAIQTLARRVGNEYVLTGTKSWITYAPVADVALVFAKTDPSAGRHGISAFMVPLDRPEIRRRRLDALTGSRCLPTGEIIFEDCPVPLSYRIGPENQGFYVAMSMLDSSRVTIASRALGVAQSCFDAAVEHARNRRAFGQEIGQFQLVKGSIADMMTRLEAARLLVRRAAWLRDRGETGRREASMAKLFATEACAWVAQETRFLLGAMGFSRESYGARCVEEAHFLRIAEGTSNIHRVLLADDALGYKPSNPRRPVGSSVSPETPSSVATDSL